MFVCDDEFRHDVENVAEGDSTHIDAFALHLQELYLPEWELVTKMKALMMLKTDATLLPWWWMPSEGNSEAI